MDKSKIIEIVDRHLPRLLWELQLNMWKVNVLYRELDRLDAEVTVNHTYEHATITIDPNKVTSEKDVLDSLRHELFHVIHSDFQIVRAQIAEIVTEEQYHLLDHAFVYAAEKTVLRLERAFDHGLNIPLNPQDQ